MRRNVWQAMAIAMLVCVWGCSEATPTPGLNATATPPPATVTIAATAAATLTATKTAAVSPSPADLSYKGQLVWWQPDYTPGGTTESGKAIDGAIAAFGKRYPGIEVKVVGYGNDGEGLASLSAAVTARSRIDIFRAPADQIPALAERGLLVAIDPALTDADKADFYPNILSRLAYKGKVYGWPLWVAPTVMHLNPRIFAERNVPLPPDDWTYEQFVDTAKKLTFARADKTAVYGYSSLIDASQPNLWSFIYGDEGKIVDLKTGKFEVDTPNAVKGLTKQIELAQLYKVTPLTFGTQTATEIRTAFRDSQTLAMYSAAPSDLTDHPATLGAIIRPMPLGASTKRIIAGTIDVYAVTRNEQNEARQSAAMTLARFLTGSEVATVPHYYSAPPARQSVTLPQPYATASPLVAYTDLLPIIPQWPRMAATLQPHLRNAILGYETADAALGTPADDLAPALTPVPSPTAK